MLYPDWDNKILLDSILQNYAGNTSKSIIIPDQGYLYLLHQGTTSFSWASLNGIVIAGAYGVTTGRTMTDTDLIPVKKNDKLTINVRSWAKPETSCVNGETAYFIPFRR